jgi:putative metallohydrolase (TIGR04338 family)
MTSILIDSPITGKQESLTQAEFNSYMAQTNGAVLKWIVASDSVTKHGEHDQKTHGSWATGGSGLDISQVMGLHKSDDPLQKDIYAAEQSLDSVPLRDKFPKHPQREIGESTEDYDKRYKEYTDEYEKWAIDVRTRILSQTGERLLDGSPDSVKKYIDETIKQDWFTEAFGDGKSLPPLNVKIVDTPMSSAAGRYRLNAVTDGANRVIDSTHEISIDRQSVKAEQVILHEISHYATAISQTTSYEGHGVEFARKHIFMVEKVAGLERATKLKTAYKKRGIKVGD